MTGESAAFELAEDSPIAWHLEVAVVGAANASDAHLIAVERFEGMLRLTFDRDISQALITHLLQMVIEANVRKVDIGRDSSHLAGGD